MPRHLGHYVFGNARAVAALWQRFVMQVGNEIHASLGMSTAGVHKPWHEHCRHTFVFEAAWLMMCMRIHGPAHVQLS
jgi:hypothetical protein